MSFNENLAAAVIETRKELGIRRAADALGVNPRTLVDSRMVQSAISAVNLDEAPDLDAAIADAIKPVIYGAPQLFGIAPQAPPTAAEPALEGPQQWTQDDVDRASPSEVQDAIQAGLLIDLGVGPRRQRR
jgi:hypothetical protein